MFLFAFSYHDKLTEFKVEYNKVPIDFFFYDETKDSFESHAYYYFPDVKYPSGNANSVRLTTEPKVSGVVSSTVFGMEFPIPENFEEILAALYGKTWRIPDASWDDSMIPNIKDLPDFGYGLTYEQALASK